MSQPPAPDDPARWSGPPGQREPTQQFTPAGQPGHYPPPGQYPPPGEYGQPGQQARPGGYPTAGAYGPPPGPPWSGVQGGAGVPPPRKGGNSTAIVLVVVGVLLVAGLGIGLFLALRDDGGSGPAASPPGTETADGGATLEAPAGQDTDGIPPATQEPTGLGSDPAMDALAEECFEGDMGACDDLFMQSESDSAYEDYGDTCAGRQPLNSGFCTTTFGG